VSAALYQLAANPHSGVANPPHWGWYVILYFFLGGLAAGSYFIAMLLDLAGDPRDREAVRLGYTIAFPLVIVCGLLLFVDLGVPLRFWHLLIESKHVPEPILKLWSPISVGSWVLTFFGFFSFVSFVGTMVETGRVRWEPLRRIDQWARERPRPIAVLWGALGAFFGFFLAGYTGVLVTGTSIAVWHNARLMGALFLASAASTSYALLLLLLHRRRAAHADTLEKLTRADQGAIVIELVVIALTLALLGGLARPFIWGGFGVVFWLGVVGVGLLVPLVLHAREHGAGGREARMASACVLVGGLLLRFVVVMSPQWPRVSLFYL
jgi:protein NrfD